MRARSSADSGERRPEPAHAGGAPVRGGSRALTAILPNGKVVWLRAEPSLAPAVAVRHLADQAEQGARWQQAGARSQRVAIATLARTTAADAERLNTERVERARKVRKRLITEFNALDRQVSNAIEQHRTRVDRQQHIERESLRRLRRRDIWDQIVLISALPLFAAYGQRGRPFGANNLALFFTLLVWLVGDEIVDVFFRSKKEKEHSPYALRDADIWSYLAPVGNVLAGWWLMDGLQHERFVTGRVDLDKSSQFTMEAVPAGRLTFHFTSHVELRDAIGSEYFEDFRGFTNVPAVATMSASQFSTVGRNANAEIGGVSAEVVRGRLRIHVTVIADATTDFTANPVPSPLESASFYWMVDTDKPASVS